MRKGAVRVEEGGAEEGGVGGEEGVELCSVCKSSWSLPCLAFIFCCRGGGM